MLIIYLVVSVIACLALFFIYRKETQMYSVLPILALLWPGILLAALWYATARFGGNLGSQKI